MYLDRILAIHPHSTAVSERQPRVAALHKAQLRRSAAEPPGQLLNGHCKRRDRLAIGLEEGVDCFDQRWVPQQSLNCRALQPLHAELHESCMASLIEDPPIPADTNAPCHVQTFIGLCKIQQLQNSEAKCLACQAHMRSLVTAWQGVLGSHQGRSHGPVTA